MERGEQESNEERYVREAIERARQEEHEIPDDVARIIASWYHSGQGSAFYSFASSGAMDYERLREEFVITYTEPNRTDTDRLALDMIGTYWIHAPGRDADGNRPPVEGWHQKTKQPEHYEQDQWRPPLEIWVADLAAYNNGRLHGLWIDATQETDEIGEQIAYMLSRSPVAGAEEWAIFDYSNFYGLDRLLGENPSLETVHWIALGIEEHGEAFAQLCGLLGTENADDLHANWNHYYRGEWDSLRHYAEEMWSELGYEQYIDDIPEGVRMFVTVDYDDFGNALSQDQHVVELENGHVVVFDTRL